MTRIRLSLALCLCFGGGLIACSGTAQGPQSQGPDSEHQARQGVNADGTSYDAVPLIPREVLFGNPTRARPHLSPDGTKLAYLAPSNGVLNIWVRTVGQDDDRVVTDDRHRGIRGYFWARNGDTLVYVQDKDGDENWHIYAIPASGGQAVDLTPIDGVQAQIIKVDRSRPNEILVGLNDRDRRFHDVYKLNLNSGERTLVQNNDINAVAWVADHQLNVRIAQVFSKDGGVKLLHRNRNKARWKTLMTWGAEDLFTSEPMGFASDDRTLYLQLSTGTQTTELRSLDVKTGAIKTLATHPTADVGAVFSHPTDYRIQAVSFTKERREWRVLDPSVQADFDKLAKLHHGDMKIIDRDDADQTWLVAYNQDRGPIMYYSYDRASKTGSFLFSHRPELEDLPLAEMKPVSYQSRDGLTIHAYLTTPVGVEARNLPTVIMPHGGPWARDHWGFRPQVQLLANRGYAVLQPNFRGSTGYGKAFLNAADREWGGKMQDDITDGTKWLVDQGISDPQRLCMMGGSYGGYATLMGLVREPDLYACGVDIVGVANLITWMQNIPPYWRPWSHILHQRVGNPDTEPEFLKSRSPVYQADKIKAPLLIVQGANDPRVPRAESTQIRDAVKKNGTEVQFHEFSDEGHGFARPENRLKFSALAEKFLAEHLGGRYQE